MLAQVWRIPTEWWVMWLADACGDDFPLVVVKAMRGVDESSVNDFVGNHAVLPHGLEHPHGLFGVMAWKIPLW